MCNRYRMSADEVELARAYGIDGAFDQDVTVPPPEIFPKKSAWIIRQDENRRVLDVMAWGFPHRVPGARGGVIDKSVTNVRNLASPFWRSALKEPTRRCLVPVTAFSEYGQERGADGKMPLHWFDVPSRPVFTFAGIWRSLGEGKVFAFLTSEPNPLVAPIHPKAMPVILHEDDHDRWLTAEVEDALTLAAPYPSQLMRAV